MESIDTRQLASRAKEITQRELGVYMQRTAGSMKATERARKVMPLGVPSSFQAYDPHPIVVRRAQAAWMEDVDGNRYVDFDLGFGALFAGHCNPGRAQGDREPTRRRHAVRHAVRAQRRRRRDARRSLQAADVAIHQQRHRGNDGRHPRRSRVHRSRQDRQGRGWISRSSRRGDDLDEAAHQRGRARRRAARDSGDRRHHARRARRHQGRSRTTAPISSRRRWPAATSRRSSSSR